MVEKHGQESADGLTKAERPPVKKGKKGFLSESALTKIAGTGALISVLSAGYYLDRSDGMNDAISGLKDKATEAQIQEIKRYKSEIGNGMFGMVGGAAIGGFAVGYGRGRDFRKKNQKPTPSR